MPFADFEELREPLRLPYRGKPYTIRPVGLADAPRLLAAFEDPAGSSLTADELRTMLLGDAWAEMQADNVPAEFALRCEMTALADFRAGREHAQFMWDTGGDPKAVAAWAQSRTPVSPTSATAAASTTKRRASGTGTKTSPTSPEGAPESSPGSSSSTSGRSSKRPSRTSTPASTSRTKSRAARGDGSESA